MALFSGIENFVPAFQGRQLAIQSGQGAGQSIARGTAAMQRGQTLKLEEDRLKFQKDKYNQEWQLQQKGMNDLTESIQRFFGGSGTIFDTSDEGNYAD